MFVVSFLESLKSQNKYKKYQIIVMQLQQNWACQYLFTKIFVLEIDWYQSDSCDIGMPAKWPLGRSCSCQVRVALKFAFSREKP